jgi:hypothetical protein
MARIRNRSFLKKRTFAARRVRQVTLPPVTFPIFVASGSGQARVTRSESEALAFAALFLVDQLHVGEMSPLAVAEELAKAPTLSATC